MLYIRSYLCYEVFGFNISTVYGTALIHCITEPLGQYQWAQEELKQQIKLSDLLVGLESVWPYHCSGLQAAYLTDHLLVPLFV